MEGKGAWSLIKQILVDGYGPETSTVYRVSIISMDASGMDVLASKGPMTSTVRL